MRVTRGDVASSEVTRIATRHDGVMGVSILDLTDHRSFVLNGDQVFPTASTIKLPLLVELDRQDQEGDGARLLDHYTMNRADLVDGSAIMRGLSPGMTMVTNHDLAQFMVAVSDNAATNVLIGRVGMQKVNAMLRAQGLTQTTLRRRMTPPRTPLGQWRWRHSGSSTWWAGRRHTDGSCRSALTKRAPLWFAIG